ncbi:MAG: glycosyltransferase family 39 protein [Acidobacteriota bacterium]
MSRISAPPLPGRPAFQDEPPYRLTFGLVIALTLAGLAMRLEALSVVGLWWDEFVTLGRAAWPVSELLRSLAFEGPSDVSLDSSPPLLHLLVHLSLALGGHGDVWVKLPSVLAGALTIPVVWRLGRRLFSGQTALAATAITAFSLFPVHYSREARPYALYLLCALTALLFLLRAMDSGRRRDWAGFVVANSLMFYASYLASATFAAQGMVVLARAWTLRRAGRPDAAKTMLVQAGLAAGLVLAAYAPWIPAHLFQLRTIHGVSEPGSRFASAGFFSVLRSFSAYYYQGDVPWPAILGALALVGLIRHLAMGRRCSLAILAVWSLTALGMAAVLPTAIHVSVRYLVNIFFLFAFLVAGGIEAVAAGLGRFGRGATGAVLVVGLGAAACLPAFSIWDIYVKRDSPSMKSVLADLAATRINVDEIRYYRPRHLKIVGDWYLDGSFDTAAAPFTRRYRRFFFLSPADDPSAPQLPDAVPVRRTFWADIVKAGRVNRSPLPLTAPYATDFGDLSVLSDAASLDNLTPDLAYGTLALYDCRKPGRAVFTFDLPPGVTAGPAAVRLGLALRRGNAAVPNARLIVSAGTDPDKATTLATVTAADFPPGAGEHTIGVTLPPPDPATGRVSLVMTLDAGDIDGFLEISSLAVDPPATDSPADAPPAWEQSAAAIAANTPVSPGLPQGAPLGGDTLYGFADLPRPQLGLGGLDDLTRYMRVYPDDKPVYTLADDAGRIRARYFDPLLRWPLTAVPTAAAPLASGFGRPLTARGLWAGGAIAGQTVRLGETTVTLPVAAPAGSLLALGDDGRGRLHFAPSFDRPLTDILAETTLAHGLVRVADEPAISCYGDAPCLLTYAVTAPDETRPITGLTAAWYPMTLTDHTGHNQVTAQYSTDGATYHDLGELRSTGNYFFYYGGKIRQAARLTLPTPANRIYVRFVLSGGGARLYSSGDTLLTLEADLAKTGFAGLTLPAAPILGQSDGSPAALTPTQAPPALGLELREGR